jgi:RNA-directed DNA polymerase
MLYQTYSSEMQASILHPLNLRYAYARTRLGAGKFRNAASKYNENSVANNQQLIEELYSGLYIPEKYIEFTIFDPKERIVHAPRYRDKIVQHLINNILAPIFAKRFIPDSYACIVGKGNRRAVLQLQNYMRCAESQYGSEYYVIKADIKKFFYTIDRLKLKLILGKHIECNWTYALLCTVIDSSPGEIGLPLGNLTSQLFANVYLNQLDQFIKRTLQIKYYVRYADDLFCFVPTKSIATEHLAVISNFVTNHLNLALNPKKSGVIRPTNGLDGLGFKIFSDEIRLKYQTRANIHKRFKDTLGSKPSEKTQKELELSLNGWLNHAKLCSNWHYFEHLIDQLSQLEEPQFRINLNSKTLFELQACI